MRSENVKLATVGIQLLELQNVRFKMWTLIMMKKQVCVLQRVEHFLLCFICVCYVTDMTCCHVLFTILRFEIELRLSIASYHI